MSRASILVLAWVAFHGAAAEARPVAEVDTPSALTEALPIRPATTDELNGMASLSCSGGFVDIGRKPQDLAVVITNGHCATSPMMHANQFVQNIPYTRSTIVLGTSRGFVTVTPSRVLYATLTGTDLALIELKHTNQQLLQQGIRQFRISPRMPALGLPVRVTSGFWKETQDCTLSRSIPKIIEGFSDGSAPSITTWAYAMSNECKIRGGYSGTPVLDRQTQEVVALAFTSNENGEMCTESNPCEEDQQGRRTVVRDVGYVARVNDVAGCVQDGQIVLQKAGCQLYH